MTTNGSDAVAGRTEAIRAEQFLFLARGFTRIFWGQLLSLVLCLGLSSVVIPHIGSFPAFVVGVVIAAWGYSALQDAGPITARWLACMRAALFLIGLELYFAVFYQWWLERPETPLFLVNILALILVILLVFLATNIALAQLGAALGEKELRMEARLFAGGIVFLLILPLGAAVFFSGMACLRYESSLYEELWQTFMLAPGWSYILFMIPCSLTLIGVWKAKNRCYALFFALRRADREPSHSISP